MSIKVDLFQVGPQKAATTWLYRCLLEHPQLCCATSDAVHYFDIFHHRGLEWYKTCFPERREAVVVDATPSYLRSLVAAERIAQAFPDAKIAVTLRNPIERAFSHYWHEKKKGNISYVFSDVLRNFDCFANWVETGCYSRHLERFFSLFPQEQVLVQRFEGIGLDPHRFLSDLLEFVGVETDFMPTALQTKINPAIGRRAAKWRGIERQIASPLRRLGLYEAARRSKRWVSSFTPSHAAHRGSDMETLDDVDAAVVEELNRILDPEIERLEKMLDWDLSEWREWKGRSSDNVV